MAHLVLASFGIFVFGVLGVGAEWRSVTSAGGCLKWQLVARNCLENLLVEHDSLETV